MQVWTSRNREACSCYLNADIENKFKEEDGIGAVTDLKDGVDEYKTINC